MIKISWQFLWFWSHVKAAMYFSISTFQKRLALKFSLPRDSRMLKKVILRYSKLVKIRAKLFTPGLQLSAETECLVGSTNQCTLLKFSLRGLLKVCFIKDTIKVCSTYFIWPIFMIFHIFVRINHRVFFVYFS